MKKLYEVNITMKPDQMIDDILELMDLVIKGEAVKNHEKGFHAYVICNKISKKLMNIHHFENSGQTESKLAVFS